MPNHTSGTITFTQSLADTVISRNGRHKRTHNLGEWAPPAGIDRDEWNAKNKSRIDAWKQIFEIEQRAWDLEKQGKLLQADMLIYLTDAIKLLRGFK